MGVIDIGTVGSLKPEFSQKTYQINGKTRKNILGTHRLDFLATILKTLLQKLKNMVKPLEPVPYLPHLSRQPCVVARNNFF